MPAGAGACDKCGEPISASSTPMTDKRPIFTPEMRINTLAPLLFNWIWALSHRLWLWGIAIFTTGLIYKISFFYKKSYLGLFFLAIDLVLIIVFYLKAYELAWRKNKNIDIIQFEKSERVWNVLATSFMALCIFLICFAVYYPSFLRSTDKAKYNSCLQVLSGLKVAEEMYIADNQIYVDMPDLERLGMYMIPECTNPNGCGHKVRERINNNCKDFSIKALNNGLDYEIKGTAADYSKCKICVTNRGFLPVKYNAVDCAVFKCP